MQWNTRFCPTITSPELHVGHLYTALVNEREAHRSGGRFSIRIDDTQLYWKKHTGEYLVDFGKKYIEQISNFMEVDKVTWQSLLPEPKTLILDQYKDLYDEIIRLTGRERAVYDLICEWIPDRDLFMYPRAINFAIEKVVWDFNDGINWMIRGEDLVSEACLYDFFGDLFGLPRVLQTYIPRLRSEEGQLRNTAPISKRKGNYTLDKQIEKFGYDGVIENLKQSCLIDPDGDFYIENIRWNPTIVGFIP